MAAFRFVGGFAAVLGSAVLAAMLTAFATPVRAESIAMVTDLSGKAAIQGKSATILTEIEADARVQLDAGARLVAIYLKSGDEYTFSGPAQVQFRATEPQVLSGAAPQKRTSPIGKGGKGVTVKVGGVTQVGFVMRSSRTSGRIKLLSLASTTTLETAPQFRWQQANAVTRYGFKLVDEVGKPLFETEVQGTSLRLPPSVALVEGQRYVWELSAQFPDGRRYISTGDFSLASAELRAQVEALRPAPNAPVSSRVAFAAWLEQMELHDEARKYWRALAAERPDDSKLKSLAGE